MSIYPIGPWPNGVNFQDPVGSLEPSELSLCENYRLDAKGHPYKRPGSSKYNNYKVEGTLVGGSYLPCNFLTRFYREADASKTLIAAANGVLKKGDDLNPTTNSWTVINTPNVLSKTNLISSFVYKDRLYMADGVQPLRYESGVTALKAGHFIPTVPVFDAFGVGGGITVSKTYKYKMTSVQGDLGEGTASPVLTVATGAGDNEIKLKTLQVIAAGYNGTARRLYRTLADGSIFYLLAELDNVVTTYDDVISDATLSLNREYVECHAPRTDHRFAILGPDDRTYWFGRTGANASTVEVSEVGWPDRILEDDFFAVNNNDGDIVTAGCKVPGGLLFFKRNSTWLLRQFGSGLINISYHYGCVAPFSIQITPDGCMFLSQEGKVCVYNGKIVEIARSIRPELVNLSEAGMGRITSAYHQDRFLLAYDPSSAGYNFKVLEYEFIGGKWDGPHTNGDYLTPSYFCVFDSLKDNGELYWGNGGLAGSFVMHQEDTVATNYGHTYIAKLQTGQNALGALEEKEIIRAFVRALFLGDTYLEVNVIREDNRVFKAVLFKDFSSSGAIVGTSKVGEAVLGGYESIFGEKPFDGDTRTHQPIFEVTDQGRGTILKLDTLQIYANALNLV